MDMVFVIVKVEKDRKDVTTFFMFFFDLIVVTIAGTTCIIARVCALLGDLLASRRSRE